MKRSATALAALAALLLAPLAAPSTAFAQKAEAAAPKITPKDIDRGGKEAPALIQAAGVPCQMTTAAFRGEGSQKTPEGKTAKVTIYETACQGGLGYILVAPQGGTPQAFDCVASQQSSTKCALPANADPKQGLAQYIQAAGRSCTVSDARYIGTARSGGQSFYEVACGSKPGYQLAVPITTTGKPQVNDCAAVMETPNACTLPGNGKAQIIASLQPAIQASGKTCQVSDVRYVGESAQTSQTFYEVGCGQQPGFMLGLDPSGTYKQTIDCAKAAGLGGGCKLTDTTVAENAENATYTKLASKAGFPCDVSKYRFIGTDKQNREVVELACSNRPDGGLAVFSESGPGQVLDCVRAGEYGQTCKLTDPSLVYPKYTAALEAKGKKTCKVSGAKFMGRTQSGDTFIETACADGGPGWVLDFGGTDNTIKDTLNCRQAASAGNACSLPSNVAAMKGS